MKTLAALVLAVILLSSCGGSKKELRGYIEEGTPDPTLIWHVRSDGISYYATCEMSIVGKNGISTIVEIDLSTFRFPGSGLVLYKGTHPLARGRKVFIRGYFMDDGLFLIEEAKLHEM
jgi:hypothetical protein